MSGEITRVWQWTWQEIWLPLAEHEQAPSDLFVELYRELSKALKRTLSVEELADIIDSREQSRDAFMATEPAELLNEAATVRFLEKVYDALDEFDAPDLGGFYFDLLSDFISKFSLRYDLQRPCILSPTLTGLFASLVRDLRVHTNQNAHLQSLMEDFDHAIRDLRGDLSDRRIKTCIQKQVNLLEAIGRSSPGITHTTLGRICDQVSIWPHDKVKDALKNLYGFACDYPGIRHGGTPASANQTIGVRDLVSISILLIGFTPYLCEQLDSTAMYQGR